MSKKKTAAFSAGIMSAALVGGVMLAPSAVAQTQDSAFGISADGLLTIPPTPYVEGEGNESVVGADVVGLAEGAVLNAEASPNYAHADVAGLSVLPPGLPGLGDPLVQVDGTIGATCDNGELSSQITELSVLGTTIPIDNLAPNTTVVPEALEGVAQITLNQQEGNTVTAVSVELLQVPGFEDLLGQTIDIASATCTAADDGGDDGDDGGDNGGGDGGDNGGDDGGNGGGDNGGDDGAGDGGGDEADDDGSAPTPTPQPGHLDVTG